MADILTRSGPGSSSLFELLVHTVRDYAIFALDTNGTIVSWNRGAEQLKGYAAVEAIGQNFSVFFTSADREAGAPQRLLAEARERGSAATEAWRIRKDGTPFWASVVLTALHAPDGSHIGFAKVTRDLTQRREAEEALRLRDRQLTDAQELAGLGSWEWNVEADRVTWTDELYRIYGLEPQSFGATFPAYLERVHPEDRERVQQLIRDAVARGGDFQFEERIIRPDGGVRVLRSRGRVVRDAAGRPTHLTGACLDITDLRRAEEQSVELARQEAARQAAEESASRLAFLVRASELLASSLDYVLTLRNVAWCAVPQVADWCIVDLVEGDTLRRLAMAHSDPVQVQRAEQYFADFPPERGSRFGPWQVIDSGEPAFVREITDETLKSFAPNQGQLEMLRALRLTSALIVPLRGRDGTVGALTLATSESGRRLSEHEVQLGQELGRHAALAIENAQLHRAVAERNARLEDQAAELEMQTEELQEQARQTEQLMEELQVTNEALQERTLEAEQANRAKSQFLAAMSHELRTPLNAIFGYADLIDLGIHGPVTPKQSEALERIKRNQRALLGLINDLLSFARIDAGRLELKFEAIPVCDVVADLEPLIEPQLLERELTFEVRSCADDLLIRGERERVDQILLNLLTNSIKFTPPGGWIRVEPEPRPECVLLRVTDSGCGIPRERLDVIFDPFVQAHQTSGMTGERGVGLGLAISRELAHAMGGTLTVESEPGHGSTFTLSLPRT